MSEVSINITAEAVAWYGAIVATMSVLGTLILGILNYLSNKPKIKIVFEKNRLIRPRENAYPYDPDKSYVCITISNVGVRTLTVNSAGFEFLGRGEKSEIMINEKRKLPCELTEGRSVMLLVQQDKIELKKVRAIYAKTLSNKEYKKRFASIGRCIWYKFFKYKK